MRGLVGQVWQLQLFQELQHVQASALNMDWRMRPRLKPVSF
jgi:hypothetical protein